MSGHPAGAARLPRYAPDVPFPPYAFVPGQFPHPTRDPAGHRFGTKADRPASFDPERWRECPPYLFGIDLFNHGYYWEAHEAWESLWHGCGRTGRTGDFIRALIRLAAAGVKVREEMPNGVRSHGAAAAALFRRIADELGAPDALYMGLRLRELGEFAAGVAAGQHVLSVRPDARVAVVFDFPLRPA